MDFLKSLEKELINLFNTSISTPRHLYLIGFMLLLFSLFVLSISSNAGKAFFYIALTMTCIGFVLEAFIKARNYGLFTFNKSLITGLIGFLFSYPCYIMANHTVNQVTSLSPEHFFFAVIVVAFIYTIKAIWIGCILVLGLFAIYQMASTAIEGLLLNIRNFVSLMHPDLKNNNKIKNPLVLPRFIATISLIAVFSNIADLYEAKKDELYLSPQNIVLLTNYYESNSCSNIKLGEKVAFLKNNKVSVATNINNEWVFELRTCQENIIKKAS